jgi:hypothetical protein
MKFLDSRNITPLSQGEFDMNQSAPYLPGNGRFSRMRRENHAAIFNRAAGPSFSMAAWRSHLEKPGSGSQWAEGLVPKQDGFLA